MLCRDTSPGDTMGSGIPLAVHPIPCPELTPGRVGVRVPFHPGWAVPVPHLTGSRQGPAVSG